MTVIESIRFTLRDGVSEDDFRRRNLDLEAGYLSRRPGFLSREIAVSADQEWLVVVHWASEQDADATISAFFGAPETQEFLAAVDVSTVWSGRYRLVPTGQPAGFATTEFAQEGAAR